MIQAAINPETKEFLGLIIPKEDLYGTIAIHGTAEDWEAFLRGGPMDPRLVGVSHTTVTASQDFTISIGRGPTLNPAAVEVVEVDNLGGAGE